MEPNRSKDVIQGDITALGEKMAGVVDDRTRPGMRDALHKLYQELEGPDNVKHFELGRDPAAPPAEPEPSTGRAWQPSVQPQGVTFDDGNLDIVHAVGRTLGFTRDETQRWADQAALSTHRAHMPESARMAQTQTALEAAWGVPKDSPRFQVRLARAVETLGHYPGLWEDAQRAGMDLDAFVYLEADKAYTKAHPQP